MASRNYRRTRFTDMDDYIEDTDGNNDTTGDNVENYNNNSPMRRGSSRTMCCLDDTLTEKLAVCASRRSRYGRFRPVMRFLEWSAHGLPWILGSVIAILASGDATFQTKLVNMLSALLVDIIIVSVIKGFVRRRRPAHNVGRDFIMYSVDVYSFPSGHATRSIMLMMFILSQFILTTEMRYVTIAWGIAVSISRVLLGRHYVSDVVCGMVIGFLEYILVTEYLWIGSASGQSLIGPMKRLFNV